MCTPLFSSRRASLATLCGCLFVVSRGVVAVDATKAPVVPQRDVAFIVDGSGSIDTTDWDLQKRGIVNVIEQDVFVPRDGSISISVIQFAGYTTRLEVPFTVVHNASDIQAITDTMSAMDQLTGGTNPGDGIQRATEYFTTVAREGALQSYCLTTDGTRNQGPNLETAIYQAKNSEFGLDKFGVVGIEDPLNYIYEKNILDQYKDLVFEGQVIVAINTESFVNLLGYVCMSEREEATMVGLEVIQTVQALDNHVRLVQNKETLVRAYFESNPANVRIRARLRAFRQGQELPESPLTASNSYGYVATSLDAAAERHNPDRSLNFEIPVEWLSGNVVLRIEPIGSILTCAALVADCQVTLEFEAIPDLEITLVALQYHDVATNRTLRPHRKDMRSVADRFLAVYPIAKVNDVYGWLDMGDINGKPDVDVALEALKDSRE